MCLCVVFFSRFFLPIAPHSGGTMGMLSVRED